MVGGYDINDYWIDIGQIEEYHKANMDYGFVFER
jgi:ADP-glucose pyrophosphorylase